MKKRKGGEWWVGVFFTLLILSFTLVVWGEEKSGGSCSEENQSQNAINADTRHPPSGGILSLPEQETSPKNKDQPSTNPESYFCRLIAPTNLPTDYLVIVGMGGVFIAISSLGTIRRQNRSIHHQAVQVRKQTGIFNKSAEAASKTVEIIISKERARLQIEPGILAISQPLDPLPMNGLKYRIFCHGTTPATIIESSVWAQVAESSEPYRGESYSQIFIPSILVPTPKGVEVDAYLAIPDALYLEQADVGEKVRRSELFVHFYGYISIQGHL